MAQLPTVSSLTISPTSITKDSPITLTAAASDTDGTIVSVAFYRDTGSGVYDASDPFLGYGTLTSGKWVLSYWDTSAVQTGSLKLFAVAQDNGYPSHAYSRRQRIRCG